MKHKVDLYEIKYTTDYLGKEIIASGIVLIPRTDEPISTLAYQHGTITSNAQAPSQLEKSSMELRMYEAVAATGIMIVVPDFIGFGASSDIMHPYFVEEPTASAVVDNIYAAKNLAKELGVTLNSNLYLAGYSQGGYATMAAHKFIEEKGIKGFELQASFPSSGGYNVKSIQKYFFDMEVCPEPYYMAYVALAYHNSLGLRSDLSCYFNEPYASAIPKYFDGEYSSREINDMLNDTLEILVNNEYLKGYAEDLRFQAMDKAFEDNSLVDWAPQVDMYMYHGEADLTVPFQNSLDTYNQLIENGASESVVNLIPLPNATHTSGIFPYVEMFIGKITNLEGLDALKQ